mmetsp:Transcript_55662/g.107390  ORF Transcript_55662/g.107390 Transcript_55662/m.107390 type:complete len:281 (-) Transcript_55662:411-1253(-)
MYKLLPSRSCPILIPLSMQRGRSLNSLIPYSCQPSPNSPAGSASLAYIQTLYRVQPPRPSKAWPSKCSIALLQLSFFSGFSVFSVFSSTGIVTMIFRAPSVSSTPSDPTNKTSSRSRRLLRLFAFLFATRMNAWTEFVLASRNCLPPGAALNTKDCRGCACCICCQSNCCCSCGCCMTVCSGIAVESPRSVSCMTNSESACTGPALADSCTTPVFAIQSICWSNNSSNDAYAFFIACWVFPKSSMAVSKLSKRSLRDCSSSSCSKCLLMHSIFSCISMES